MAKRKIVKINEDKCDGCGLCVPNCAEGAIRVIDKKARLVSDVFCDGLGACLGHCPRGAITIEEREAEGFDEKKAREQKSAGQNSCPGSRVVVLSGSKLANWPVQLALVPAYAPYLNGANILIAADCVPFAYPLFHGDLLNGRILLIACPKLDNLEAYRQKISQILEHNNIRSIAYAHMEVPCCLGLLGVIQDAVDNSGKKVSLDEIVIGIKGERLK